MPPNVDLLQRAIIASPFGVLLGIMLTGAEDDRVTLTLPYRSDLCTAGDLIHGGAIASLIDTAATAAAWSNAAGATRGTTIGFTLNFLAAARSCDLTATASVIQRGRTICVCDVDVRDPAATAIARALVTYKLGS